MAVTLPLVSLEEARAFSINMMAHANEAYSAAWQHVFLLRMTVGGSLAATVAAARLYYVLYHAPLRHAWRLREKNKKMVSYFYSMMGLGSAGVSGMVFLLSPIGFSHRASEERLLAEELESLAMRSLVLQRNLHTLYVVGGMMPSVAAEKRTDHQKYGNEEGHSLVVQIPDCWLCSLGPQSPTASLPPSVSPLSFFRRGLSLSPTTSSALSAHPSTIDVPREWKWVRLDGHTSRKRFRLVDYPAHSSEEVVLTQEIKEKWRCSTLERPGTVDDQWWRSLSACQRFWDEALRIPLSILQQRYPSFYLI